LRGTVVMNCALCKQEIKSNFQVRNDHVYHECCAITYDKDEKTILTNYYNKLHNTDLDGENLHDLYRHSTKLIK